MKKLWSLFLVFMLSLFVLAGCTSTEKQETPAPEAPKTETVTPVDLNISAAASLKDALEKIQTTYEGEHKDVKLVLNMGSSGALQQQIEQGSPTDLFISAGKSQMDALAEKNLIKKDSRVDLLTNDLVLVTSKDNTTVTKFEDLSKPEVKHIGIGTPDSVPAGKYAQEALTSMKLWDSLTPKYVEAKDVRQVLAYVESGNAEAGIVYKSDTTVSDKVKIAAVAPDDTHKPIVYPAAILEGAKNAEAAAEFLDYLKSEEAQKVFEEYGFNK